MNAKPGTSRRIRLGHITGVFGVKGWVKVHSDTNPRENIVTYASWYLSPEAGSATAAEQVVEIESGRRQGKTIVAKLKGVEAPEQAATLTGHTISVDRDDLPALESGEYYWADIIGFAVRDVQDRLLGTVDRLFETGANDVLVVRCNPDSPGNIGEEQGGLIGGQTSEKGRKKAETEILIPWIKGSVILEVELTQRVIRVDWDPDY